MFETWIRKLRQNSHHRARTSRQTGTRISSMRARPRVEPLEERCLLDADLALTKTALPEPVLPGQNLAYTLAVTNNGPDTATATTLTDTLPAGLTFINAVIPNGASFTNSSGNLTFALGDLASGATATVTINVTATATGSVSNTASVSSSINDPDLTNNSSTATSTINAPTAPADLAVSTFTSPASVVPGQALTYTIDVTNNGTGTATNTSLTDVLPTGVTFISATTPAGTTFTNTNGTLVFTLGDMAPGAVNTVTIEVTPSAAGDITNTATATTDAGDANVADNQSTTTVTVNANSTTATDLAITKSATPEPVVPGQLLTYTLGVTNNGPSDVTDATVTDVVPSGLTFINATPPAGTTFTNSNGILTFSLGSLASGASDTITLLFTPNTNSTTATTISNTATVTSSAGDTNVSNNQAAATSTINPTNTATATDLSITKSASPEPVVPGQAVTYQLFVTNNGPNDVTDATVTDVLPAGMTFVSATTPSGTFTNSNGVLTFSLGSLASGLSDVISVTVLPTGSGTLPATLTNTATVTSSAGDTVVGNNQASATTTVNANGTTATDLTISKTASPEPVVPGQLLTYTLTVNNAGPSDVTDATVIDVLPAGLTFINASTPTGTTFSYANGILTFSLGALASGASDTITVLVTPNSTATTATTLTNTATVTSSAGDTNVANNQASATTTVNPTVGTTATDLSITKTSSPEPVVAGQLLTYTLVVTNNGPNGVTDATVTDVVPSGLTFINATTPSGTTFTNSNGVLTLSLGNLASGASDTITLLFTPNVSSTTAQTLTNTATVTTSAGDTNPANNQATATTTVNPASSSTATDLAITKTASPEPVVAGQLLTYTLTVSNNGSNGVTDATVTDVLPAGLTFINASTPAGTTFTNVNGVLTFSLGSIAAGASDTITLLVTPSSDVTAATSITNTATVTSSAGDTNPANNQATATSTVNPT